MAKFRQGFVSNSSSSSFILNDTFYTKEEVKKYLYKVLKNYAKKQIKYYEERLKQEPDKQWITNYLNNYKAMLDDEYLDKHIKIETIKDLYQDLEYWYSPRALSEREDLVIMDDIDNFIPEEVAKKIIKKYFVYDYCLHMG